MIRIFYPEPIYKLLKALSQHKVYVVGGFVRDMLLCGRGGEFFISSEWCHPRASEDPFNSHNSIDPHVREADSCKDVDLVTSDSLEMFLPTVQNLCHPRASGDPLTCRGSMDLHFRENDGHKTPPHFRIMEHYQSVQFSFEGYQVTLGRLRHDAVCDGRQADVVFVDTLQEDVWRRDFTINALYADPEGQVIDFVGGYQDLAQKKVRFIGDPATRVKEDVLRILRYVRFCSLLEVSVDSTMIELMRPYIRHPRAGEDPLTCRGSMDSHFREDDNNRQDLNQITTSNRWQHEIKKILKLPLGKKNLNQLMPKN